MMFGFSSHEGRVRAPWLALVACAVVGAGGCLAPELPSDLKLTCAEDADCPSPLVCRVVVDSGRCVDAKDLTRDPPALSESSLEPADVIGRDGVLTARLKTKATLADRPVVSFGPYPMAYDADASTDDEFVYVFFGADAVADGSFPVSALLIDELGARAAAQVGDGPVVIDTTPPGVLAAATSSTITRDDGVSLGGRSLTAVGPGATLRVWFSVTEALADVPAMFLVDAAGVRTALPALTDPGPSFRAALTFDEPDGAYTLEADLVDLAGNSATVSLLPFSIDTTPPAPFDDAALDALTYARVPWGTFDAARSFSIEVTSAEPVAIEDATLWRVLDDDGAPLLTRNDLTLTPGASFALPPLDRTAVFVTRVDAAGNESAPRRVPRVRFTASLVGKQAGAALDNPHRFFARRAGAGAPLPPGVEDDEVDGLRVESEDDVWVTSTGGPSARLLDGQTSGTGALCVDPLRGVVAAVASAGAAQHWDGAHWRTRLSADPEGDGDPQSPTSCAHHPRAALSVLFDGFGSTWAYDGHSAHSRGVAPFAPSAVGFDGARVVGVALDASTGTTRLRAFAFDPSRPDDDAFEELCDAASCPETDLILPVLIETADQLIVAESLPLIDARFVMNDGVLVPCDDGCPLRATPLRSVAVDLGSGQLVGIGAPTAEPFPRRPIYTSVDGDTFTLLCGPGGSTCPGDIGTRAVSDPGGAGVFVFGTNGAHRVRGADITELQRTVPCGDIACLRPTERAPEVNLALAYVPAVQSIVGFERVSDPNLLTARLLELYGSQWVEVQPVLGDAPTPRAGAAMAAHGAFDVVVFGGTPITGFVATDDTFVGTRTGLGVTWTQIDCDVVSCPPPDALPVMVTYGGAAYELSSSGTYRFDGSSWEQLCGDALPCTMPMIARAATVDTDADVVVAASDDGALWEFDGAQWSARGASVGYAPAALFYDERAAAVFALGATGVLTSEQDGPDAPLALADPEDDGPLSFTGVSAATDPLRGVILSGDGNGLDTAVAFVDTYVFDSTSSRPAHLFEVRFDAAGAPDDAELLEVRARVHASARADGVSVPPRVRLFDGRRFTPLTSVSATEGTAPDPTRVVVGGRALLQIDVDLDARALEVATDAVDMTLTYTMPEAP